jgi:lipopolysaccharide biosynthesis regulator YciM
MKTMYSEFRLLNAINTKEAIKAINHVLEHNPLFLNKVTNTLLIILKSLKEEEREWLLEKTPDQTIKDLYIEIKEQHYKFQDVTRYKLKLR